MRQLATTITRRPTCRARDRSKNSVHVYAALAARLDGGFATTMPLDMSAFEPRTLEPVPSAAADHKGAADARLRAGDVDAAVANYTAALARATHPALFVDRANALLDAGLAHAALLDATRAFVAAPDWRSARVRLAEALGAVGDAERLETLVEIDNRLDQIKSRGLTTGLSRAGRDGARRTPAPGRGDTFDAAKARGDAAFKSKQHIAAIEAYTAAVRLAPSTLDARKLAAAFSNRAAAASALGAHRDALADGFAAAALAPDWVKGHVRVATALRALGKPRDAIEAYFAALRILPGDLDLNTGLCDAVEENRHLRASQ